MVSLRDRDYLNLSFIFHCIFSLTLGGIGLDISCNTTIVSNCLLEFSLKSKWPFGLSWLNNKQI